jgi:hypothetical protein
MGMADRGSGRFGTREEWERVLERVRAVPAYLATARETCVRVLLRAIRPIPG